VSCEKRALSKKKRRKRGEGDTAFKPPDKETVGMRPIVKAWLGENMSDVRGGTGPGKSGAKAKKENGGVGFRKRYKDSRRGGRRSKKSRMGNTNLVEIEKKVQNTIGRRTKL